LERPIETGNQLVSLFGAVYKKKEREGLQDEQFKTQLGEEIGDTLWYLANLARLSGLDLNQIAKDNLDKARTLFDPGDDTFFDSEFPPEERLPRRAVFSFSVDPDGKTSILTFEGKAIGAPIRDNAPVEDHYRFHDVFHLAFMAVLGWSPVMRDLLRRKRKSKPEIDENEDGARPRIMEEGISAIVFEVAEQHNEFREITSIPYSLLAMITRLVRKYEVGQRTRKQWQRAIFFGLQSLPSIG
jgi:hypothetical protein